LLLLLLLLYWLRGVLAADGDGLAEGTAVEVALTEPKTELLAELSCTGLAPNMLPPVRAKTFLMLAIGLLLPLLLLLPSITRLVDVCEQLGLLLLLALLLTTLPR
jgi:hypothetical protein